MNRTWSALLSGCLVLLMAGCDGGSRGSGITTAQGNVESVQAARRGGGSAAKRTALARLRAPLPVFATAHAQADVEGIRVFVEGTSVADETDADGSFVLRGEFDGIVTIRFQRAADAASAAIAVNAPAGGTLTLNDVRIDERSGEATAQTQSVGFDGLVSDASCSTQTVYMVSRQRSPTDTDVYTVRLDTSSLHDARGTAVPCESLVEGDLLRLQGTVNDDGTFGNADIVRER
jgi:hypothetical protein